MKVFLTGASGFVGAGVARALLERGDDVHCLVRPSSNLWRLHEIQSDLRLHTGDFMDATSVLGCVKKARPEVVFHLGAHGTYPTKHENQTAILETILVGAQNVFSAARNVGVSLVVSAGSSSEYGSKDHPTHEDEALEPNSVYGVAKTAQTFLGQHLSRTKELPVVTLRLFSIYGPFEESGRLMPTAIAHALKGTDIPIANPKTARDFLYLPDAVRAFLLASQKPQLAGEVINVGSGVQSTLQDVFDAVIEATGSSSKMLKGAYKPRAFDTNVWVADTKKMKKLLGLTSRFTLAEGIADMVKWFPTYAKHYTV